MEWLIILLIGAIQGVTEFMPVSSSAHLLIVGDLFNLADNFELYVLANLGTLGALILFTRKDLWRIIRQVLEGDYNVISKLGVSMLPAGLLGFFLADFFKVLSDNLYVLIAMLLIVGVLMIIKPPTVKHEAGDLEFSDISWPQVLGIAFAQTLALIPGTSRAGITILGGLWLGLKQDLAVKWSFLLAIPLVSGAILRVALSSSGAEYISREFILIVVVNLASFIVGLLAISFLLKILKNHSLRPFGFYRVLLSLTLLGLLLTNVL